ncbi:MAG TPA: hypothetical protein VKB51_16195 [bacterium]|nr:hypothetical protein [bacterium]
MSRANAPRGRGRIADDTALERRLAVGRPLQARLIALEKQIGLFSEEQSFAADSRFNHPAILPAETPLPKRMVGLFAADLEGVRRLSKPADACHATDVGPYRVYCLSYFHYDGFRALLYVERDGAFVAAWAEEEVLQPDSPRTLLAGVGDVEIQAFLEHIPGV